MHLRSAKPTRCAVHRRACGRLTHQRPQRLRVPGFWQAGPARLRSRSRSGGRAATSTFQIGCWSAGNAPRDAEPLGCLSQSGRAGTSETASFARSPVKTRTLAEWPATSLAKSSEQETLWHVPTLVAFVGPNVIPPWKLPTRLQAPYAQEIEPTHPRGGHLAPAARYRSRRAPRADTRDRAGTCAWVRYALALLHGCRLNLVGPP